MKISRQISLMLKKLKHFEKMISILRGQKWVLNAFYLHTKTQMEYNKFVSLILINLLCAEEKDHLSYISRTCLTPCHNPGMAPKLKVRTVHCSVQTHLEDCQIPSAACSATSSDNLQKEGTWGDNSSSTEPVKVAPFS